MKFSLLLLIILQISVYADVNCSVCRNKISGQYLQGAKGEAYCSKTCFNKTLPHCAVCRKAISGRFTTFKKRNICSEKCLLTLMPKCTLCNNPTKKTARIDQSLYCIPCSKRPTCFNCNHPFVKGFRHADKRLFCFNCKDVIIFSDKTAKEIYQTAVKEHTKITGTKGQEIPPMIFADYLEMKKQTGHADDDGKMSLRGYYNQTFKESTMTLDGKVVKKDKKKIGEAIYLLNGVCKEDLLVTAVHELTHDWLTDYYPGIKVAPLWIEEGACQYVAWIYAKNMKYDKQIKRITAAEDDVYGKGFKFFHQKFGDNGWAEALAWMAKQGYRNKPPIDAVRPHKH